jgi:hypothetical protein
MEMEMQVQTERTEASETKLVRAGEDDDERFANATFRQDATHPFHAIRHTVPSSQSYASFFVYESRRQPSPFFELVAYLVGLLMSPILVPWILVWFAYFALGGNTGECPPPVVPCSWLKRWLNEKFALMRRDVPKFEAQVGHLIGSLSPLAPPAIAEDLQGITRLFAVSYSLWMPADWHLNAHLFAAIAPRAGTVFALAILFMGVGIAIANAPLIENSNTTATGPLTEGSTRLLLVICIVAAFVISLFFLGVSWVENGQSSAAPRVLLDFLAQHSHNKTQLHAGHHIWIPPRPTTASEKAEARAGLRDLAARQQQSVAKTSAFFQMLLLQAMVSANLFVSLFEYFMAASTPLYVLLAFLVVEAIALVALFYFVEKKCTRQWVETLQVAYHVIEMRELILEHAEAVAAGPGAQPQSAAGWPGIVTRA